MAIQGFKDLWRPIVRACLADLRNPKTKRRVRNQLYKWIVMHGATGETSDNKYIQKAMQIVATQKAIQRVQNEGNAVWCNSFPPAAQQRVCHLDPKTHRVQPRTMGYANEEQTSLPPVHIGRMMAEAASELSQWRNRTCALPPHRSVDARQQYLAELNEPRRTSCGTGQPCKRVCEDEWDRVFVAPLPQDHVTMNDELPEDIMTDLRERFDLLECGEWDLNEFQAFIANTIV